MPRRIDLAEFVISAVAARDLPKDGAVEVALVGRSNVGKSSLINALVRRPIARTSAAPGKTRQANVYRIQVKPTAPFYLVDLPGYGHAGGGEKAQAEFASIIGAYFDARSETGTAPASALRPPPSTASPLAGCILAIDARHPGLRSDVEALRWLSTLRVPSLLVATKVDKLSQSEKSRLKGACETALGQAPLAVSAETGEGLDELWRRIRELAGT